METMDQSMTARMRLKETVPDAYRALARLERHVRKSVCPRLLQLANLRASIVNGCAYCVDLHSREALGAGESTERLFAVAVWRESAFFNEEERIALELVDAITRIDRGGVPDELWARATRLWSDEQLGNLIVAVATINVWNRLAVATRQLPQTVADRRHRDGAAS